MPIQSFKIDLRNIKSNRIEDTSASDLASFDPAQRAWIAAAGDYSITLGQSSRQPDAVLGFNLPQSLVVDQVKAQLTPQVALKALTPSKSN